MALNYFPLLLPALTLGRTFEVGCLLGGGKFISYKFYKNYKYYKMEMSTIAVAKNVKEKIQEFGNKGESFSEVLERLVRSARERQLHDLLMDTSNCLTINEARQRVKKWQKS